MVAADMVLLKATVATSPKVWLIHFIFYVFLFFVKDHSVELRTAWNSPDLIIETAF